jgi:hypothetical protein
MLAIPYLLLSVLAALVIIQRIFPEFPSVVRIVGAFLASIVLTGWANFLTAWLMHSLGRHDATFSGAAITTIINLIIVAGGWRQLRAVPFHVRPLETLGVGAALALSFWVMQQRLSGNPLMVSLNTWGDTALHIGIARSFSQGDNYPPVMPIFSGEPIRYHFGFDFYAGALERVGLPIQWAFNLPGALGFTAILVLIFALAHYLWRRVSIGVIAAILFITNSSLAFLRYFDKYPSLLAALQPHNWWNLNKYLAIGPYQAGERISIFETLNPYLTQTHLIISIAIVLFISYALLRHLRGPGGLAGDPSAGFTNENLSQPLPWSRATTLGILSGASFWINGIVFLISMVFFSTLCYVYSSQLRRNLLPSAAVATVSATTFVIGALLASNGIRETALLLLLGGLILGPIRQTLPFFTAASVLALPQLIWLAGNRTTTNAVTFHNGYLVDNFRFQNPGSYADFASYWWLNLGLAGPLIILAALAARKPDRKLLLAIMAIFAFGNVVVLGTDVGGHNHKVFNLWEALINVYAAYGLVWVSHTLWNALPPPRRRLNLVTRPVLAIGIIPTASAVLVLSGLLNLMTLKNDPRYPVFGDSQPAISWIEHHTSRNAVFLTAYDDVYTVPTLAGRTVYLGGFSIWAPGMGYDDTPRQKTIASIYTAPNQTTACEHLRGTGVDYIQVSDPELNNDHFHTNNKLFPGHFIRVFTDGHITYYDAKASCTSNPTTAPHSP